MRYLGSKTMLLDEIVKITEDYTVGGVFCDPFGGIGTVGSCMKRHGFEVITGDILYFAHCFQVALIERNEEIELNNVVPGYKKAFAKDIEQYLNMLPIKNGWFVEEYASKRKFFTIENAVHIQACINCILGWKEKINESEYKILMASLIQSMDKVANTAGTYYAYLKQYYRKAKREFHFQVLPIIDGNAKCRTYLRDANQLVKENKCDVLYLDPPYNERSYRRYYHLPEAVALGIKPKPIGKSGIYVEENEISPYNQKRNAKEAFARLIANADAGCIIFHYTDNGLIDIEDAKKILVKRGRLDEFYFDSKGYHTARGEGICQHHILRVIE